MTGPENEKEKILYVSGAAGIAGDMFLAALIELSGGGKHLGAELAKLPINGYVTKLFRDVRGGISGLRFFVEADDSHTCRHLSDIRTIIMGSGLGDRVKAETMRAFALLAEAEAKVHGTDADSVHFHEVGAVDSIIDLTGAMIMLDLLGWPRVMFSPLNVGSGTVSCEHGVLPVPAPAAAELLKGVSVYSEGEPMERVTPTGAALVKTLGAVISSAMPAGKIENIGTGLGSRESIIPNALRVLLLEPDGGSLYNRDLCCELCANIDDMTPQDISVAMERLFAEGALDVWFEPIQMKKNRPAAKLCCLCAHDLRDSLADTILRETTTLGVRMSAAERYVMERRTDAFETPLGVVRVKSALSRGTVVKQVAEFDDVLRLAKQHGMTVMAVREILASLEFLPGAEAGDKEKASAVRGEEWRCSEQGHKHGHEHEHIHGHYKHKEDGQQEGD